MDVTSGSARLATESHGDGEPTVLLIHAGVTDQRSWSQVVERLADRRCLTYDQRGYGRTAYEPEDGWSRVDDAVAVLDAYGADSVVVVACSMGGRVALHLALTHPERVRALALIAPAISGGPGHVYEPEVQILSDASDAAWEREDLAEVNRIDAHVWLDGPRAPEGRVGGSARELFLDMNRIAIEAEEPGEERPDVEAWDRLGEIGVPTLLMIGDLDLQYLKDYVARAAATMPDARLVELAGVAHLPQLEGDERTLAEIAAFVATA